MSKNLCTKVGECAMDNLIAKLFPPTETFGVTIRKLGTAATLKRGTVLALSVSGTAADGKLVVLGTAAASNEVLEANCILADDVEVGTTADAVAVAYRTGHMNKKALIVASGYTMTAADIEALRKGGILLSEMAD